MEELINAIEGLGNINWIDYAQLALTLGSIILSAVAIIIAIHIPKEIANKQNQIALFEKRLACYTVILNLCACAVQIAGENTNKAIQAGFKFWIGKAERFSTNELFTNLVFDLKQMEQEIISGQFLFPSYDVDLLQKAIKEAIELVCLVASNNVLETDKPLSKKAEEHKTNFCCLCNTFREKCIDSLEQQLKISINKSFLL